MVEVGGSGRWRPGHGRHGGRVVGAATSTTITLAWRRATATVRGTVVGSAAACVTDDERRRRRLDVQRVGDADAAAVASSPASHSRQPVERQRRGRPAAGLADDPLAADRPGHRQRSCSIETVTDAATSTAGLELGAGPVAGVGVDDDGEVRPAVVDVVAHHQLAGAGAATSSGCGGGRRRAGTGAGRGRRCRRPGSRRPSAPRGPWRSRPTAAARAATRGCTHSVCDRGVGDLAADQAGGSVRMTTAGPTSTTPRRVGRQRVLDDGAPRRARAAGSSRRMRPAADVLARSCTRWRIGSARAGCAPRSTATAGRRPSPVPAPDVRCERRGASRPMTNGSGDDERDEAAGGDDHQLDPAELPADRRSTPSPTTATSDGRSRSSPAARRSRDRGPTRIAHRSRRRAAPPPAARRRRAAGRRGRACSTPRSSASGVSSMRWPSTAGASALTSSTVTNGRPCVAASARAARDQRHRAAGRRAEAQLGQVAASPRDRSHDVADGSSPRRAPPSATWIIRAHVVGVDMTGVEPLGGAARR